MKQYDLFMDSECILLCDTLNDIPGLETTESCCGHGREPYLIFMKVSSLEALQVLGRSVSRNYSLGLWRVVVDNSDSPEENIGYVHLESLRPLSPDEMMVEVAALEESLRYWMRGMKKKKD